MIQLIENAAQTSALGGKRLTPLLRVVLANGQVFAKCEFSGRSGSHKYRVYCGIVDALERDEPGLRRGDTLVDFTSGNGGIALAQVALERGYRACVVAPATISREKLEAMQSLGAMVHSVPPSAPYGYIGPDDLLRARLMAARIAEESGHWFLDQANNPANVEACQEIGREICAQLTETPTHLVCGIGTGGAITGITTVMKAQFPTLRVIGVEPAESTTVVARLHHEAPHHGAHRLSGLGAGEISASLDLALIDDGIAVSEAEWAAQLTLLHNAGVRVGKSSAAGMAGAVQICEANRDAVCVTVFFDSIERYGSEFETLTHAGLGQPSKVGAGSTPCDDHVELSVQRGRARSSVCIDITHLGEHLAGEAVSFAGDMTLQIEDKRNTERVFEALAATPFLACDDTGAAIDPALVGAVAQEKATLRLVRKFASVKAALDAMRKGKLVIVLDEREEEGDFFLACSKATPEAVNLMLKAGRGVLCVAMRLERFQELGIRSARDIGAAYNETPFGESVDYLVGTTTGVSAADRCRTIRALGASATRSSQLRRNGHVRTLEAHEQGLIARRGHTEAAVELATLARLAPATALIEILNEDGSIARQSDLFEVARRLNVPIIRVAQIHAHIVVRSAN